jgi:hypothetical protein
VTPGPVPQTPPAKGSLGKWLAGHKWEAGLGGGGIAVTLFLAYRARQKNAAGGTSSNAAQTNASQALPLSYYPPTSGGGDGFANELAPILQQLTTELGQSGQSGSGSGSSYLTLQPGQVGQGGGFTDPTLAPLSDQSGNQYVPFASADAAWSFLNAGGTGYVETAPGIFSTTTASTVPAGSTWVYEKAPPKS